MRPKFCAGIAMVTAWKPFDPPVVYIAPCAEIQIKHLFRHDKTHRNLNQVLNFKMLNGQM